jgi:ATP-dependent RNA helicase SUPV3L1/SUV3
LGLNLNIQRIVFASVKQFSGSLAMQPVPPQRIKQIAGRAGRFGFGQAGTVGEVSALTSDDLSYVRSCMEQPNEPYPLAGVQPPPAMNETLSHALPQLSFCALLGAIRDTGQFESPFSPCISKEMLILAYSLKAFPSLRLSDLVTLSCAPVNVRCPLNVNSFRLMISNLAAGRQCPLEFDMRQFANPRTMLPVAESFYRALDLYLWLSTRYPEIFTDRAMVMERREALAEQVNSLLSRLTKGSKSPPVASPTEPFSLGGITNSSATPRTNFFDGLIDENNRKK